MVYYLGVYLCIQLLIGYFVSLKIKNEDDFLLGGRQVSPFLLSFSLFATWFGAETCIGTSAEVYDIGLAGGRADPFGYSVCLILLGFFIATKIWDQRYVTLADFFKTRFDSSTEKLAITILVISSMIWGGAQIRAFGQIITAMTDLPVQTTMVAGFFVVATYSLLGGLLADILTDFFQGIVLIIGLSLLLYMVLDQEGVEILRQPPERLSFKIQGESFFQRIDRWMIPILGSLVAQESIARLLAAPSPNVARRSAFSASAIYAVVGLIPVLLGLIGPAVLPNLAEKEHFIISLSEKYLPEWAQLILMGALVSAILSTIDSILLAGGGLISHNLLIPFSKGKLENFKLLVTRISVLAVGLASMIIALQSDGIYQLVEFASSLGSAGVLVITIMGLWVPELGGKYAARAALITGVFAMPFFENIFIVEAPFISSIFVSLICYLVVANWLEPQKRCVRYGN